MKKIVKVMIPALIATQLIACAPGAGPNEGVGTVVGGVAGGLIGSRFGHGGGQAAAIAGGAFIGAIVGNKIGQYMDKTDRLEMNAILENSPDNQPTHWTNPNTNREYTMVPTRTYGTNDEPCREYQTTAFIGGKKQQIYGTACRQADGSWRVENA